MNTSIGQLIINEVISQHMVSQDNSSGHPCWYWSANTAEQLEALVEEYYVRKPTPAQLQGCAHKIIADLRDSDRLADLSHRALIEEACAQGLGENLIVIELCNRVLPGWEK